MRAKSRSTVNPGLDTDTRGKLARDLATLRDMPRPAAAREEMFRREVDAAVNAAIAAERAAVVAMLRRDAEDPDELDGMSRYDAVTYEADRIERGAHREGA